MNRVILIGNLTRDPETGSTANSVSYCKFSIAVNRPYVRDDGTREVDFFNVVAWRAIADNAGKYLKKGKKVAVCGRLETRTYTLDDGVKRYATDIIAEEVQFLSSGNKSSQLPEPPPQRKKGELEPVEDENLPF